MQRSKARNFSLDLKVGKKNFQTANGHPNTVMQEKMCVPKKCSPERISSRASE
jgi:hypothetical protein